MKEKKGTQLTGTDSVENTSVFREEEVDVFKEYEEMFGDSSNKVDEYADTDEATDIVYSIENEVKTQMTEESLYKQVGEDVADNMSDIDDMENHESDNYGDTYSNLDSDNNWVDDNYNENSAESGSLDPEVAKLLAEEDGRVLLNEEGVSDLVISNENIGKTEKKKKEKKPKKEKKDKAPKGEKVKKEKVKKEKKKTSVIHSINTKISRNSTLGILLALIVTYFVTMSGFKESIDSLVKTNMITAVSTYNTLLEDTILLTKNNLTTSNLTSLFKEEGLAGVESSHVALVDEEGNYTFNINYTLIGKETEYQGIRDIVKKRAENKREEIEPDVIEVVQGETTYCIGYYACENGWTLLCYADKAELYKIYDEVNKKTLVGGAIILVFFAILGFFSAMTITKPIQKLTSVIHKTAGLDFRPNPELDKLCKRKDETAEMAKALLEMQVAVKDFVSKIETASVNINSNANNLKELSSLVNDNSTDNSATTEELAAGMEETAATTAHVEENINYILSSIDSISSKTKDGQNLASKIMDKASKLKGDTIKASDNGRKMFANVRKETSVAIEKSKDVDKINSLTKTILDISDQTSLLSINASIEAARAGEAGRGFAVVAEQIGHLANLSASTVENIGEIVEQVNDAVNSMAACLETTLNFLEEKVIEDYGGFISVSDEYNNDAVVFEGAMKEIDDLVTDLEHSTTIIADAISGINSTIGDSSVGISDIAGKTSDIVSLTIKTNEMVDESVNYSKELESVVELFKL